jgi:hypothetical protein
MCFNLKSFDSPLSSSLSLDLKQQMSLHTLTMQGASIHVMLCTNNTQLQMLLVDYHLEDIYESLA